MFVVDVFQCCLLPESSQLESASEGPILTVQPLMIYQQPESLFEAELGDAWVFHLPGEGICHPTESHRPQPLQSTALRGLTNSQAATASTPSSAGATRGGALQQS